MKPFTPRFMLSPGRQVIFRKAHNSPFGWRRLASTSPRISTSRGSGTQPLKLKPYQKFVLEHVPTYAEESLRTVALRDGVLMSLSPRNLNTPDPRPISMQWLRDHCQCSKCVHPSTKQRLIETFQEIPADISTESIRESNDEFKVVWSDGHESSYTKAWLQTTRRPIQRYAQRQGWVKPVFWTGESIKDDPPTVDFEQVMSTEGGLLDWLEKIRQYGFCYVSNTPVSPEATEKLLERIAFIRNTHYGGFWDFTSDLSKGDTAYTQLGIGLHTDNTYFSDPCGLQLFHLLSHTDGEGGTSGLADGFAAAKALYDRERKAYVTLSSVSVYSHASGNEDGSVQPWRSFPTLVHDPETDSLVQVRWNTTDRAQIDINPRDLDNWYNAARKWSDILQEFQYWEQLKPGTALIFDNWRVLHARSAFTGKRRMCGGYINRDDFIAKYKMLKYGREENLKQVFAL